MTRNFFQMEKGRGEGRKGKKEGGKMERLKEGGGKAALTLSKKKIACQNDSHVQISVSTSGFFPRILCNILAFSDSPKRYYSFRGTPPNPVYKSVIKDSRMNDFVKQ